MVEIKIIKILIQTVKIMLIMVIIITMIIIIKRMMERRDRETDIKPRENSYLQFIY